ncbi:MAG: ribosome assembly factor SBDS [Patescibacteria group bacterium]|nr:ribosome assembly factor SBDS [Patescibacteria group bacterium]
MTKGNKLIDDHIQVSLNIARLKSHGRNFEVAIDPDKVVKYKEGFKIGIEEMVQSLNIYADVKKGLLASTEAIKEVFRTEDNIKIDEKEILRKIIDKGEIQFHQKYREELRRKKLRRIINIIHINAVDPKTGIPHPENRIEAAMEEAKIKIKDFKKAEEQVDDIIKALRPIIPISVEMIILQATFPSKFSSKIRRTISEKVKIISEDWLNDGGLFVKMKLPAGLKHTLIDEINNECHGGCVVEEVKK